MTICKKQTAKEEDIMIKVEVIGCRYIARVHTDSLIGLEGD